MITQDEALAKAQAWLNEGAPAGAEREVRFREFDLGWVVWAAPAPLEADPVTGELRPPADLGDATGVVDRATGEISTWPSIPIDAVIAVYQERRAGR
ncbi:hypothetical protein, partial [Kitasatospora cheerisanensis]|uniref:Immunity protein 35 domain-containing protein n=1 Tax=Kitasatospora cheerisanensis KCTC 2395 TaxID=1348663 RepID=A0A066YQ41_9ACTN